MLTRDQANVQDFLASGLLLYEAFSAPEERHVRETLFALDGAIASFGRAEMVDRQTGRDGVLTRGHRAGDDDAFNHYQNAGVRALKEASETFRGFRSLAEQQQRGDVDARALEDRLRMFDRAVRIELAALELKPADVERLAAQLDEAVSVASIGDPLRFLDHVARKIDELGEVRSSDDRGMIDNIPWWKVVAVAVFFAIAVWALIKCAWRWWGLSCSTNEALVYVLIAKAAALGYRLC